MLIKLPIDHVKQLILQATLLQMISKAAIQMRVTTSPLLLHLRVETPTSYAKE
ncbi:hypothetical protein [Desulfarculus baarsii]|uniref:hypothetical protein n=1 Tax=Desulfarculus baarsii TaxID=453230 RepID=UPI00030BF5F7|nr:hypothetical protein [Desulfarculus baarsii]